MNWLELIANLFTIASIFLAGLSAHRWYSASRIEMPEKAAVPDDLPGLGRVKIHGEDYAITLARLNAGLERLDNSLEAINQSSRLNAAGAKFAMMTALSLSAALLFSLIDRFLKVQL